MEKKYFKLHRYLAPYSDYSTQAKKMIYDSLCKYNNTLLYATEDELILFFNNIISEFELHKGNYKKWPKLEVQPRSDFRDFTSLLCDGRYFIEAEELKLISLDDFNPFQIDFNEKGGEQ